MPDGVIFDLDHALAVYACDLCLEPHTDNMAMPKATLATLAVALTACIKPSGDPPPTITADNAAEWGKKLMLRMTDKNRERMALQAREEKVLPTLPHFLSVSVCLPVNVGFCCLGPRLRRI